MSARENKDQGVFSRQSRKLEHIRYCLHSSDGPGVTGFEDVHLIHNCLPELDLTDIETRTSVAGLNFSTPILLNAITGGAHDVAEINRQLAYAARVCNIPMAVGSQTAALEDKTVINSFKVVRDENPDGIVMANIGAHVSPDDARRAAEMISADALQVHLNVAQELVMLEGDRSFRGYKANIERLVKVFHIPVLIKEVGFGMAKEQVKELKELGVAAIDIGGCGGTNFVKIERARVAEQGSVFLDRWGIPTACSLAEAVVFLGDAPVDVIASGGIRNASDIVKALALGAKASGIAGSGLKVLQAGGVQALITFIRRLQHELRCVMLLIGAGNISAVQTKPVVITGLTGQWLGNRGIDIRRFAQR